MIRYLKHTLYAQLADDLSSSHRGGVGMTTTASDSHNIVGELCVLLNGVLDKTFVRFVAAIRALIADRLTSTRVPSIDSVLSTVSNGLYSVRGCLSVCTYV